jgi:predicted amidophosphoribosyltransferase
LGWSIIGWVVALSMAVKTNMTRVHVVTSSTSTKPPPPNTLPPPPRTLPPPPISSVKETSQVRCASCQGPISPTDRFCPACGRTFVNQESSKQGVQPDSGGSTKWCDECERDLPDNAKFCSQCGSVAQEVNAWECIDCQGPIALEDKFCPSCGSPTS